LTTLDAAFPCSIVDGKTNTLALLLTRVVDIEGTPSDKVNLIFDDLDVIKFEAERIRHDNLGYLYIEMEMNYTALQFDLPLSQEFMEIPMNFYNSLILFDFQKLINGNYDKALYTYFYMLTTVSTHWI